MLAPVARSPSEPAVIEVVRPQEPWVPLIVRGCIFGDGVHHLRAALDALVCEMCHVDGTPTHLEKITFPVKVESPQQWQKATTYLDGYDAGPDDPEWVMRADST